MEFMHVFYDSGIFGTFGTFKISLFIISVLTMLRKCQQNAKVPKAFIDMAFLLRCKLNSYRDNANNANNAKGYKRKGKKITIYNTEKNT